MSDSGAESGSNAKEPKVGSGSSKPRSPTPLPSNPLHYVVWLVLSSLLVYLWTAEKNQDIKAVPYSLFKQQVGEGNVRAVTMQGTNVTGEFRVGVSLEAKKNNVIKFSTHLLAIDDVDLLRDLEEHGVEVNSASDEDSSLMRLLMAVIPWILIFGLFFYSRRLLQGKLGGFGQVKSERYVRSRVKVTFDDVAGLEQAKSELKEIIDYLNSPERYLKMGAKIPRGVLLMGPPGTGKTLLAKATAGEAGVPFFHVSGSEFVEMFVGVGASRVRDLFNKARAQTPSLIFIDEIDSIGRARSSGIAIANDERDQTLNQILAEMDGFSSLETVVVLAATNRPDILDPALLRPGRFDRKVTLELPHQKARLEIFKVHIKNHPLAVDVNIEELSRRTVGFSGAEIANLVNEAALNAARNNKKNIDAQDFEVARDRIVLGIAYGELLNPNEKKRVAYHEAGHTLVALLIPGADKPKKVSIIPRGRSLGVTEQEPAEERHNFTEAYLQTQLKVLMGGRCAEKIEFHETSSGAADDLRRATQMARQMITQWGMSERIGPVIIDNAGYNPYLGQTLGELSEISEHTQEVIDDELKNLLLNTEQQVMQLLNNNKNGLDILVEHLLDHETLEEHEIQSLLVQAKPSQ